MSSRSGRRSGPLLAGALLAGLIGFAAAPTAQAEWLGPEKELDGLEVAQQWPQITGNRLVYASEADAGGLDIRVKNLSTGSERVISGEHPASGPAAVSGRRVVWSDTEARLWLANLKTGEVKRLGAGPADDPAISGNWVCYTYLGRIQLVNLVTGEDSSISDPAATAANCAIDSQTVVWQQHGTVPGIVSYRIGKQQTNSLTTDQFAMLPRINQQFVVWQSSPGGNEPSDIVVHDLTNGAEQVIASQPGAELPAVSEGQVVWQDSRLGFGNTEVYLFDLASGVESRVTFGDDWSGHATIEGGRIVYEDVREEHHDAYLRAIDPPTVKLDVGLQTEGAALLTGLVVSSTEVPLVSAKLQVEYRCGEGAWRTGEQLTTAGDGTFTAALPAGATTVRVRFGGNHDHAPAISAEVSTT